MKATLYTVKVIKGKFKGKVLKTFSSPVYIYGITSPVLACFDDDETTYAIWWDNVKSVKEEEVEVPDYE